MSVLRLDVHGAIDLRWTLLFWVRDASPDVDYLGMCLLSGYNLLRPHLYSGS